MRGGGGSPVTAGIKIGLLLFYKLVKCHKHVIGAIHKTTNNNKMQYKILWFLHAYAHTHTHDVHIVVKVMLVKAMPFTSSYSWCLLFIFGIKKWVNLWELIESLNS